MQWLQGRKKQFPQLLQTDTIAGLQNKVGVSTSYGHWIRTKLPMWSHHKAPTTGMLKNCCSLVPLRQSLNVQLALPTLLCRLIRTIRLDYAIQFARCLPKFDVSYFPQCEDCGPAVKDAIKPVSPTKMKSGFYSLHSIILKIGGG